MKYMGTLLKIGAFVIIAGVATGFFINKTPDLKQRVIEYINPAVKERRLISELEDKLNEIDNEIVNLAEENNSEEKAKQVQKTRDLIEQAKNIQSDLEETNGKNDGIIQASLTKIIDSFIDDTPYPADHLEITEELKAKICAEALP